MAYPTVEAVRSIVDLIADPSAPFDLMDLDGFGVDLPHLRRPRDQRGAWSVARYRAMPLALRAASSFFVIRAEVRNGGEDQLVWNQIAILPAMIEALDHVGAHLSAALLAELAVELFEGESHLDQGAVGAFLAFRAGLGEHGVDGVDLETEVGQAILAHARTNPDEFVVAAVEEAEWTDGRGEFRTTILRFPDGRYEVEVGMRMNLESCEWVEIPRSDERLASLDEARAVAERERSARSVAPTRLEFVVASCSRDGDQRYQLYPDLPPDRLPVGASLQVRVRFPDNDPSSAAGTSIEATGTVEFQAFRMSILVTVDADAAIPSSTNAHHPPFWGSGWVAECRVVDEGQ